MKRLFPALVRGALPGWILFAIVFCTAFPRLEANPLTITITGTGDGTLNGKSFVRAKFTFVLTTDTTSVAKPPCCDTLDTPPGTPATFDITGAGSGTLTEDQVVFVYPQFGDIGLAHYNDGDVVDMNDPSLVGYKFDRSVGPLTAIPFFVGACPGPDCSYLSTSMGLLGFSSVSTVSFQVEVGAPPPTPTITKVQDEASSGSSLSPGMRAVITGTSFGMGASGAATFTVSGKPAPVIQFLGPTQVLVQIPADAAVGPANVVATYNGVASQPFPIMLTAFAPALYSTFYDWNGDPITPSHTAIPDTKVYVLALGLGPTDPAMMTNTPAAAEAPTTSAVQVNVGSNSVMPSYAGLEMGAVGRYKIVFTVPGDAAAGPVDVNVSVGGASSNTVSLMVGPPVPVITAIANGATFQAGKVAPNSFVSIFGVNFGSADSTGNMFPATSFNGLSVLFDGTPAPLYYVFGSLGQINLVTPSELRPGDTVLVQVKTPQGTSAAFQLEIASDDVGLFRIPDPSNASRMNGAVLFANTAWRVMPASMAAALGFPSCAGAQPITACGQPAKPKDVIILFLTGGGKATPNGDPNGAPVATGEVAPADGNPVYVTLGTPEVTIGGLPAQVGFSGISPGNAGLYQINVTIPDGVAPGDDVLVTVTFPGGSHDSVTIAIHIGE